MEKKPPITGYDIDPPGAEKLSRLYHDGPREEPPSRLDSHILAEASKARTKVPRPTRQSFNFWVAPVSFVVVVVLSVTLVLFMSREGVGPARTGSVAVPQAKKTPDANTGRVRSTPAPLEGAPLAKPSTSLDNQASRESEALTPAPSLSKSAGLPAPSAASRTLGLEATRPTSSDQALARTAGGRYADVVAVEAQGNPGDYQFEVSIQSPDTGCDQYADWWEVLSEDGRLLYRRVLDHSHVKEQPFTRGGGLVTIQPEQVVWIRAHMQPSGYGGLAFKGSVAAGFLKTPLSQSFAADLSRTQPLPAGCDF